MGSNLNPDFVEKFDDWQNVTAAFEDPAAIFARTLLLQRSEVAEDWHMCKLCRTDVQNKARVAHEDEVCGRYFEPKQLVKKDKARRSMWRSEKRSPCLLCGKMVKPYHLGPHGRHSISCSPS